MDDFDRVRLVDELVRLSQTNVLRSDEEWAEVERRKKEIMVHFPGCKYPEDVFDLFGRYPFGYSH